ncbi:MAG: hypothetical protein ACI9T8_000599 [Candidatus Saccharimonadales bacterium]|jgi:hypothetical protein
MNHDKKSPQQNKLEYAKLISVLAAVSAVAALLTEYYGWGLMTYLESFMGVFFVVFAGFKIVNLKEFATSLRSYEKLNNLPLWAGYSYPFIQILFGSFYILGHGNWLLDAAVLLWSAYNSYLVYLTIKNKGDVHCLCLGNVIKLPLSTTSLLEDAGMTAMALVMLIIR